MRLVDTTQVVDESKSPAIEPLAHDVDNAAILMGIGRTSVYLEIKERRIVSFKSGRRRLISQKAIEQWIEARAQADDD